MYIDESAFREFYKTPVEIYALTKNSDYSNGAKTAFICSINADIQPFDGNMESLDFGQQIKKRIKLYCGSCDAVCEGNYAITDGMSYRIVYVERRNLGICAVLERV